MSGLFACSSPDEHDESPLDAVNASCLAQVSEPLPEAVHVLLNVGSGRSVDIKSALQDETAPAIQWDYNAGRHQQFLAHDSGMGYSTLKAQHSGKMLDGKDNLTSLGAVQQRSANGSDNQNWQLVSTVDGQYRIGKRRPRSLRMWPQALPRGRQAARTCQQLWCKTASS